MNPETLEKIKTRQKDRGAIAAGCVSLLYWLLTIVYLELVLHLKAFNELDGRFGYVAAFSLAAACVLSLITSFLPKKANFWTTIGITAVLILLYGSQIVYNCVFGTLYSVSLMHIGGAAVTSFWKETLLTMAQNLPWLLALLVPLAAAIVLWKWKGNVYGPSNAVCRTAVIIAAVLAQFIALQCLSMGGTGFFSDYYFYHSDSATTDQTAQRFGLLTAFRLEISSTGASTEDPEETQGYYIPEETTAATEESLSSTEDPTAPTETEPVIEYNVMDIDFTALNEMTEDETIQAINNYCASLTGTNKNEYTGMLRDYNLIVICAESFSTAAIDPEITPTLYKLSHEGFLFNNYYNTFPNNTTDGEYSLCMGLYPDTNRGKSISSFYASRNSYLPFCLGNILTEQLGLQTFGYHNYNGTYYGREESHPNMGYTMKFANAGMKFTTSWPSSDLEMMEQSVDDYISLGEQFHAYYMTFSGHYQYDRSVNPMARRNWDAVKDLDYSEAARCYLSCHIELDKALEYLLQRLEEAGVADKTAIVLTGDHFPYGLTDSQYSELIGYDIDDFTKYKSTLIFWVGGMEESVEVDTYCCNVDILPTILNLWGLEYDSRMLAGTDVFSDGTHVAVLRDMSFFTDKVWFNADTGEICFPTGEAVPMRYVENMVKLIQTKFDISADILNKAYYNFVFEKGAAKVNRESWYIEPEEDTPKTTNG